MTKNKLFCCSSSISIRSNLFLLSIEPQKNKKCLKSNSKLIKKINPCTIKINNINKIKLNKLNNNFVNKPELQNKDNFIYSNNINTASIPVNTTSDQKKISKNYNEKIQKTKIDMYTQDKDLSCMKKIPPKQPEIFEHIYSLEKTNALDTNKTYGKLNKNTIPICFYNHLMFSENIKKSVNKRKNYFKTSFTQRNKKKILTIIYYGPKQ